MTEQEILNYLKEKNVNPLILEHPSSRICYDIAEYLSSKYKESGNLSHGFMIGKSIQVDEKGNVKFTEDVKHENIGHPNESISRSSTSYEVSDNQELIVSISHKSNAKDNQWDDYCSMTMTQHIFDQYGIEQSRTNNESKWHEKSLDAVRKLVENSIFYSQNEYNTNLKNGSETTSIERITRNSDLGSASVILTGAKYSGRSDGITCNVRLHGEHIEQLTLDIDAQHDILSFVNSDFDKSPYKLHEYRDGHESLNFNLNKLEDEDKDKYYDWVNYEISLVHNDIARNRLQQLSKERGLISSKEKQANDMIEAMVNGTMSTDGSYIDNNQQVMDNGSRTMGFSAVWILGLITGIMSCAFIILGVALR